MMSAELNPYPEYRQSRLPSLGKIPAHWEERRAKVIYREIDNRSASGDEELLSVSHLTGVTPRSQKNVTMFHAESYVGHKLCEPDDLVINTMWAWMGALGVARQPGIVSPSYGVYRPVRDCAVLPRYADHLLRIPAYAAEYQRRSTGINSSRLRLYPDKFLTTEVVVPPLAEQVAIVRFIRHLDQRVNRLITIKRKLIDLLNEQAQAVIHRVITRGLDSSVPLKPSGVEWLGDIPQHWEQRRLKWVLRLQRGFDLPSDRRRRGSIPVYSSGGRIDYHDVALAKPPGIVIGRYGSTDAVFFVTEPYWPHNTALFTTTLYDNNARWCFYLLRSFSKAAHSGKSAVPGVDRKDLFDIVVPRPSIAEQGALANAIDSRLVQFERLVASTIMEIDLIREYRTRLVSDVVTGQLDVRHLDLPDVDEQPVDLTDEGDDTDDTDELAGDDLAEAAV